MSQLQRLPVVGVVGAAAPTRIGDARGSPRRRRALAGGAAGVVEPVLEVEVAGRVARAVRARRRGSRRSARQSTTWVKAATGWPAQRARDPDPVVGPPRRRPRGSRGSRPAAPSCPPRSGSAGACSATQRRQLVAVGGDQRVVAGGRSRRRARARRRSGRRPLGRAPCPGRREPRARARAPATTSATSSTRPIHSTVACPRSRSSTRADARRRRRAGSAQIVRVCRFRFEPIGSRDEPNRELRDGAAAAARAAAGASTCSRSRGLLLLIFVAPELPEGHGRLPLRRDRDAADLRPADRGRARRADRLGLAARAPRSQARSASTGTTVRERALSPPRRCRRRRWRSAPRPGLSTLIAHRSAAEGDDLVVRSSRRCPSSTVQDIAESTSAPPGLGAMDDGEVRDSPAARSREGSTRNPSTKIGDGIPVCTAAAVPAAVEMPATAAKSVLAAVAQVVDARAQHSCGVHRRSRRGWPRRCRRPQRRCRPRLAPVRAPSAISSPSRLPSATSAPLEAGVGHRRSADRTVGHLGGADRAVGDLRGADRTVRHLSRVHGSVGDLLTTDRVRLDVLGPDVVVLELLGAHAAVLDLRRADAVHDRVGDRRRGLRTAPASRSRSRR